MSDEEIRRRNHEVNNVQMIMKEEIKK